MGTALHAACYGGHITVVHLLIQAGSDIDILDKEQNTPLMISVLNKHNDIVKYLVKIGADVTFKVCIYYLFMFLFLFFFLYLMITFFCFS